MNVVSKKLRRLTHPQLRSLVKKSEQKMVQYRAENVFKSSLLNELMTDKFEYKGAEPNKILVKDAQTNEPVEVNVEHEAATIGDSFVREFWTITDKDGNLVGSKFYDIEKNSDNNWVMKAGSMSNYSSNLKGIGIRLDQIHIERAIQLGIKEIPRNSFPASTLYHAKVGFLPKEQELIKVRSASFLKDFLEEAFMFRELEDDLYEPIVVEKDGNFYLDVNKTIASTNLGRSKKLALDTSFKKIRNLLGKPSQLTLYGDQMEFWKKLLEKHSILKKLQINLTKIQ